MSGDPPQPVALSYSTPRCFLECAYSYRSANAALTIAVMLGVVGFAIFMARKLPTAATGLPFRIAHVAVWTVAACGLLVAAWLMVKVLRGAVEPSRITEEGIEKNRRVYRWENIASVGGALTVGGVDFQFSLRGGPGGRRPALVRSLLMTPTLNRGDFNRLMRELSAYLSEHHPDVKVEREPTSD